MFAEDVLHAACLYLASVYRLFATMDDKKLASNPDQTNLLVDCNNFFA